MRFLPQTVLIVLMADSAKANSCLPAVPATRRAKEMMYELNASPLGEKYDATESTKTQGRHFLGRALVAAEYDVGSMFMSVGDSPSSLSMSGFEAYFLAGLESKTESKASKKGKSSSTPTTSMPTDEPTHTPTTAKPSATPTSSPTSNPTSNPTSTPTSTPNAHPTSKPTSEPTSNPTSEPTSTPTSKPTTRPTSTPTSTPSATPTSNPSATPSSSPTSDPTSKPTSDPTSNPTAKPTSIPTAAPTSQPTAAPTSQPTAAPTSQPTAAPTSQPTAAPTSQLCPVPSERRLDWFTEEEEEILGNTADKEEPWMAPIQPTAELIAKNPGIWKIQDFIDPNLVQRMLETFAYDERFERCNGEPHEHLKCKQCFRLSPSSSRETEEKELIHELIQKIKDLWPSGNTQRDYLYVQRTEPDCDGTLVHKDVTEHDFSKSATATIVFYLSDGGAGVFFPTSNVIIPPKAGMAVTWLNVHEDGSHNKAAEHGIQATPKDAGIRYSLTYRITLSGEEMTAASRK